MPSFAELLASSLLYGLPLALISLGALYTKEAQSLSIGLEGFVIAGAFSAALTMHFIPSPLPALVAALVSASLCGYLLGFVSIRIRADVYVSGLALNLLIPALASLLSFKLFGSQAVILAPGLSLASLEDLKRGLLAYFGQAWIQIFCLIAIASLFVLFKHSSFGLRIRLAGQGQEYGRSLGFDPQAWKIFAHILAGAAGGLAGFFLVAQIGAYVPGISAGRGWLALVTIFLFSGKPLSLLLSSLGIGLCLSLANALQVLTFFRQAELASLLTCLPYLAALLSLLFWNKRGLRQD